MSQGTNRTPLKIANAQAFWGDRNDAAGELLDRVPDLDYLTMDYLAEVSMSILAQQQVRDPKAGYARDFLEVFSSLIPYWQSGGRCKLITNAGGLNPIACAEACAAKLVEAGGPSLKIAVVTGDSVLEQLRNPDHPNAAQLFRHLESRESLDQVRDRLVTANAYLGAAPLISALRAGADIVITGRVADPSLTVAACVHHFQWADDDWNLWASATVAGHLIECGVQATGGISTDWLSIPATTNIGFPIVEMQADGTFVITKPPRTGGRVTIGTVAEQLLYEIGNPGRYLSPDLTVSFLGLSLEQQDVDRVRVSGATGSAPSTSYKVSATYRDGFRAAGQLTIFGRDAVKKAYRCGEVILDRMRAGGWKWRDSLVECIGAGACAAGVFPVADFESLREVVMRVAIEADDREVVDFFTRQVVPLVTAGPQGTTGYAEGRPKVHPIFRYWPCLIERDHVRANVDFVELPAREAPHKPIEKHRSTAGPAANLARIDDVGQPSESTQLEDVGRCSTRRTLEDIATARSGDKGSTANIGVICRNADDFPELSRWLTAERVATFLAPVGLRDVERFELPNLCGLNFLVHGILACGLRSDAQGKALGQVLLQMPMDGFHATGGGRE